jgi:hypothetical protein
VTSLALPMIAVRSCWVATRVRIVQHKYQFESTAAEVGLGGSQRAHRRHKLAVLATPARLR